MQQSSQLDTITLQTRMDTLQFLRFLRNTLWQWHLCAQDCRSLVRKLMKHWLILKAWVGRWFPLSLEGCIVIILYYYYCSLLLGSFSSFLGLFLEFYIPVLRRFQCLAGVYQRNPGFLGKENSLHPFSYSIRERERLWGFPKILSYFLFWRYYQSF